MHTPHALKYFNTLNRALYMFDLFLLSVVSKEREEEGKTEKKTLSMMNN